MEKTNVEKPSTPKKEKPAYKKEIKTVEMKKILA